MLSLTLLLLQQPPAPSRLLLTEFAKNDRIIAGLHADQKPTPAVDKNLEVLVRAVYASKLTDPDQIKTLLKPYDKIAQGGKEGAADEYSWTRATVFNDKGRKLIAVGYGPTSRLAAFDASGQRLSMPPALKTINPYATEIEPLSDGVVVLVNTAVQAMGMRTQVRVDFLTVTMRGYELGASKTFQCTLNTPSPVVNGRQITCYSLDDPTAFQTSASTELFRRRQTFTAKNGEPKMVRQEMLDLEFRALDRWLYRAQTTAAPTPSQKIARRLLPKGSSLNSYKLTPGKSATLILLNENLQAKVVRKDGAWVVSEIKEVKGKVEKQ